MTRLLVLRPEPASEATAAKVREFGLEVVCVPLFEVEAIDWTAPDPSQFDGVLLTSANAIRCAGDPLQRYRGLKAYAVGEATGDAAQKAGFDLAAVGESGVDRLLASVEPGLKLLHLCGEQRRAPVRARQAITPVIVYRSRQLDVRDMDLTPPLVTLIHSPRAGRRFAQLVTNREQIILAAISTAAAQSAGAGWKNVAVAEQPSEDALLALAARLCKNAHQG